MQYGCSTIFHGHLLYSILSAIFFVCLILVVSLDNRNSDVALWSCTHLLVLRGARLRAGAQGEALNTSYVVRLRCLPAAGIRLIAHDHTKRS